VALLLVAFIAIGFYFANLEDADGSEAASITRDSAVEVAEASDTTPGFESSTASEVASTPVQSDVVESGNAGDASPSDAEPEAVDLEVPDSDVVAREVVDPFPPGAADSTTGVRTEVESTGITTVVTEAASETPFTEGDPDSTIDSNIESNTEPISPSYGKSEGVRASGIYLLKAVSPDDPAIDVEAARSNLVASIAPRPRGPEGTAWIPIATWCSIRGDGALQGIVTGMRATSTGEGRFLLVRDDDLLGFRLDGRISDADAFENNEGRPRVAFLLESDAVDEVREASFAMVGGTVAWIVDGEVVSMPPLEVAIQNRGRLNGGFDLEHARWIAARLRGELMRRPGAPDPEAIEDEGGDEAGDASDRDDLQGRSAAELPASAYTSYTIRTGDSFEGIATDWFGDPRKQSLIAIANPTVDPIRLQIGQIIKLPPKDTPLSIERSSPTETGVVIHVVRSGETLSDIAVEYLGKAARWQEIHDANLDVIGDDPARLTVGMELRIP
jgi:LysM repeat protein